MSSAWGPNSEAPGITSGSRTFSQSEEKSMYLHRIFSSEPNDLIDATIFFSWQTLILIKGTARIDIHELYRNN